MIRTTLLIAGVIAAPACAPPQPDERVPPATSHEVDVAIPDADSLMPPLAAYATDDDAEPGEVMASLDHGSMPYDDVRRRLILDENGFSLADVTVVTFPHHSWKSGMVSGGPIVAESGPNRSV